MIQALALLSLTLLLLAGAIELWWGSAARQQQRKSMAHIEHSLAGTPPLPVPAIALAPKTPLRKRGEQHLDALLLRAALPTGWRIPIMLLLAGLALVLAGWWRIGSILAVPLMLVVYVAVVWLWLRARIEKQQKQILRQLPDFLDGLVRMASIGNSLPMAFQATTTSVQMPLRAVLDRTMQSARSGLDLDRALQLASQPYRVEALELLHVVLGTGMRMGGRADQILQRMSDFMRDLSHARQELHAITSETRLSAWVLGLLPLIVAAFMTLCNPTFFMPMFTHPLGHKLLLIALALESVGGFLLYRLAKSL
ncbi:type II secretion system F family protein [Dyella tabacisoli]|uniref:Pilus assembly protein n=1 Tax=Dyella tabacisoli TaxID=2282381 RepID=A0A369UL76_9GAMM|nr:type II secretion system F family protein [Dyella tabacisoli]RDD81326.1 pilus assembly protein [Dyella tabacisoli]